MARYCYEDFENAIGGPRHLDILQLGTCSRKFADFLSEHLILFAIKDSQRYNESEQTRSFVLHRCFFLLASCSISGMLLTYQYQFPENDKWMDLKLLNNTKSIIGYWILAHL